MKTLSRYGITVEQYEARLTAQGGVCAICHQPETVMRLGQIQRLAVDEHPVTHAVRELLCARCNRALGGFADDPDRLRRAAAYVENHRG